MTVLVIIIVDGPLVVIIVRPIYWLIIIIVFHWPVAIGQPVIYLLWTIVADLSIWHLIWNDIVTDIVDVDIVTGYCWLIDQTQVIVTKLLIGIVARPQLLWMTQLTKAAQASWLTPDWRYC